jgi:hypothetical protein
MQQGALNPTFNRGVKEISYVIPGTRRTVAADLDIYPWPTVGRYSYNSRSQPRAILDEGTPDDWDD